MEVLRIKVLIGIFVLHLLEECQASHNSALTITPTYLTSIRHEEINADAVSSHDQDDSVQKALKDRHIFKRLDVVLHRPNEIAKTNLFPEEPLKTTSKRKPVQIQRKADYLTQKAAGLKLVPVNRHKKSMFVNNPTFESFASGNRPFAKFQERFPDASYIRDLPTLKQECIEKENKRRKKNKVFIQPLLERKHILNNDEIPVYKGDDASFVPWWIPKITTANPLKIMYAEPVVTSWRLVSKSIAQKSLLNSSSALLKVRAKKKIEEAAKSRYRRSIIWNPKFEAVFNLKRQYESLQQKFFGASDFTKETPRKRIIGKSAAVPQSVKPVQEVKGEFPLKKLCLPKFAISQFFKPSYSYAGPIYPYVNSIVSSSSMDLALPRSTSLNVLSTLKVPPSRKTFKFHSENTHHVQETSVKPEKMDQPKLFAAVETEQVKAKEPCTFGLVDSKFNARVHFSNFVPYYLDETSKLPWNRVVISPCSYQYVPEPSRTDSNSVLPIIRKVKNQWFPKINSQPGLRWTQNIINSTIDFPNFSLPKSYIGQYFQYGLVPSKVHENNFKASELVSVQPDELNDTIDLSLPRSQAEFAQRFTTNKSTWNIQSILQPTEDQQTFSNAAELNFWKPLDFSSLRLPVSRSQVEHSHKATSTPSKSLLKPSEAHKNYSGFLELFLPKSNKLSFFQSKPATLSIVEVFNITSSSIDAQHIQPSSLKSSTNISKITHGIPKLSEIIIYPEVSNSTKQLLPKVGNSIQFSGAAPSSNYSSDLSLPVSHGNFSSEVRYRPKWNFQHVVETSKAAKMFSDVTKVNASKFDTSQQTSPTPKLSRHHQFVVEPSNGLQIGLDISHITDITSKAGTSLEGLSASVPSSNSYSVFLPSKTQKIHSGTKEVFASGIKVNRSHSDFSGLHVPKTGIVRPFKYSSEVTLSPENAFKLLSRFQFQPIKPRSIESSTKPLEFVSSSVKTSLSPLSHTPVINNKDPEQSTGDILLPQLLESPTQFVNPTPTLRFVTSKNLPQSLSSERTLSSSVASTVWSSTIERPSSTRKVFLSNLPKALQENIWNSTQFVPGESENSLKVGHETTTLKMSIMEREQNVFPRVPLPSITKYHSFHSKKEAPTIASTTEPKGKGIVMESDPEQTNVETIRRSNLAEPILKNTTTITYWLPGIAKTMIFRKPPNLSKNDTLIVNQSAAALLGLTTPIFSLRVPNVTKTHRFKRVSELPKAKEKPQIDTTSKPASFMNLQLRNRTFVSSSGSLTGTAKTESQQSQQISVAQTRKRNNKNRLRKDANVTLTHMKNVKTRRIKLGTRTRIMLQNQNDQHSDLAKPRLAKAGGLAKAKKNVFREHVMNSTKSRDVISRPMPSEQFHLRPRGSYGNNLKSNESILDCKGISKCRRSDIPVELEAFPVSSRNISNNDELSSPVSRDILQKRGLAANASLESLKNKNNLVVTLLKKQKLSKNIPENAVAADMEIS